MGTPPEIASSVLRLPSVDSPGLAASVVVLPQEAPAPGKRGENGAEDRRDIPEHLPRPDLAESGINIPRPPRDIGEEFWEETAEGRYWRWRLWRGLELRVHHWTILALFLWFGPDLIGPRELPFRYELYLSLLVFAGVLISLAVHESAHALAAGALGCRVHGFLLLPFGAGVVLSWHRNPLRNLLVQSAGIIADLLMFAWTRLWLRWGFGPPEFPIILGITTLLIGLLNPLPVYPLDGGRILREFLAWAGCPRRVIGRVSLATGVLTLGLAT